MARTRRKLPGHHNRRYKGKSRQIDGRRTVEEGIRHCLKLLDPAVADDLRGIRGKVEDSLLWGAAQVLVDVEAPATTIVSRLGDQIVADFGEFVVAFYALNGRLRARFQGETTSIYHDREELVTRMEKEVSSVRS